jgi:hypothetical protein
MRHEAKRRTGWQRLTFALLGAAVLSALVLTPSAEAGHKHKRKWHKKAKVHHVHHATYCAAPGCVVIHPRPARRFVAVPARIHRRQVAAYRPYYGGEVFFAPHRHYHAVYYFPVQTRRGIVYRPEFYCGGGRYTGNHVAYHGEHVSFRVSF